MRPLPTLPLLAILLLAAAPGAQAVFIETPLRFSPVDADAEVGDELRFDVAPANDSAAAQYAGRTLQVRYATDAESPEQSTRGEAGTVALDGKATGVVTWTVPADVDDKNVLLQVVDGEEVLATAHVRVGDAEPVMYATGGPAGGGGEVVEGGEPLASEPGPGNEDESGGANESPGFTALAILGGACVAVLLLGRRRGT